MNQISGSKTSTTFTIPKDKVVYAKMKLNWTGNNRTSIRKVEGILIMIVSILQAVNIEVMKLTGSYYCE